MPAVKRLCNCTPKPKLLPHGLYCHKGTLVARVFPKTGELKRVFGPHTKELERFAIPVVGKMINEIRMDVFVSPKKVIHLSIQEAYELYRLKKLADNPGWDHTSSASSLRNQLLPNWGKLNFDDGVTGGMCAAWRRERLNTIYDVKTKKEIILDGNDIKKAEARKELVDSGTAFAIQFSTVNRDQTEMSAFFNAIIRWVAIEEEGIPQFAVPAKSPFTGVRKKSETDLSRRRMPSDSELRALRMTCVSKGYPELWEVIIQNTVTMLRKGDFAKYLKQQQEDKDAQEGVQGKTGRKFKVNIKFPVPANMKGYRRKWDEVREALGWLEEYLPDSNIPNSKHMVWHDLRHVGPTLLIELGYTLDQIANITNHADTDVLKKVYVNSREEFLAKVQGDLESKLRGV